ncbi:hypothetical protein C5S53_14530 [Methanophagales archaeon]|jgi:hypothetical protein|nr:hypothetical protein C5S53_14530 [Methanophagales archaeon]
MSLILFSVWPVPRSLISKRGKIHPVLFTRNLFEKGQSKTSAYGLDCAEADNPAILSPNSLQQLLLSTEILSV